MTTISATDGTRRDFLYVATGTVAAVGAAGAPLELDLSPIAEGQVVKVFWRSKPIFISHRTEKEIDEARAVNWHDLPDPQPDQARVKAGHDQWLVVIGICTHLGCIPLAHRGDYHGWFCACHGHSTIRRVGCAAAPLRPIYTCRRTSFSPISGYGSGDAMWKKITLDRALPPTAGRYVAWSPRASPRFMARG